LKGPVRRADIGDAAVRLLGIGHILEPFRVKGGGVKEIGFAFGFGGAVAAPALALVALRAIGGDAAVIAAHSPADVLIKPVQQRIRASKLAGALEVVVDDAAFK